MPRGRGRPVDPSKNAAMLAAARRLFFMRGPYALSMEAVAREAGVAKATVYARYANRSALIEAVVRDQQTRLTSPIVALPSDAGRMRAGLVAFGTRLLNFYTSRAFLNFQRLAAGGLTRAVGRLIYTRGPQATCDALARWLDAMHARGAIDCTRSDRAAEEFMGMVQGLVVVGLAFNARRLPPRADIRARVVHAVDAFLRAYRPSPQAHRSNVTPGRRVR